MSKYVSFWLPILLLVIALAFSASCGASSDSGASRQGQHGGGETSDDHMQGMDMGEESAGDMSGMDRGSGVTAPKDLIVDGQYSDERFIDMMAAHHQMAIDMAEVAQREAELPEIRRIADDIVSTQRAEIEELESIKEAEFGSSEVPTAMNPEDPSMNAMEMPDELTGQRPFDRAFIDSMIPHHASAIEMAATALRRSDNPEIKRLARGIIDAQSREIGEMIELRQQNYPEG